MVEQKVDTLISTLFPPQIQMMWLLDANATMGSIQSPAVGPWHQEHEFEAGHWFHSVLLHHSMALPATFQEDMNGPHTWISDRGGAKRIDYVAIPMQRLSMVASAGVDKAIHLDINLKVDHLLTKVSMHLPLQKNASQSKGKAVFPSRNTLKLPEVAKSIQDDIAALPPAHPLWTVDEHDRIVSKALEQFGTDTLLAGKLRPKRNGSRMKCGPKIGRMQLSESSSTC